MTKEPATIIEDTTLEEIVQLLENSNVKRLPVTRGERHRPFERRHYPGALTTSRQCSRGERHRREEGSRPSVLGRHHVRDVP
jgi:CBS domain-containing protein